MFDLGFKFGCYISIKGIDEYDKVWWNRVVVSLPSRLSRCFLLAEKIGFIRLFRLYGIMRWLTDKLIFIIVSKTNESRAEYTFLRYVVLNFRTIFIIAGNVYRNLNNKFIEQISYKKLEEVRGGGIIISIDSLIFGRIHKVEVSQSWQMCETVLGDVRIFGIDFNSALMVRMQMNPYKALGFRGV